MEQLNLKVKDKSLQFVIKHPCSESYWCELFLVDETNNIRLGADSLDIILSRLLIAFLPAKNRKFFEYQSQKMFSIINLMEPHFVIAGVERENLGLELILIDSNEKIISSIHLFRDNIEEWIENIISFLVNHMKL